MKIAFSTLGCPDWSWNEIIAVTKDMCFDSIEVRGVKNELYAPAQYDFQECCIDRTKKRLKELNINISCLTTACYLQNKEYKQDTIKMGKEYIDLANSLDVPYIRLLGDTNPEPGGDICDNTVIDSLIELADYALNGKTVLLIETNGVYADSLRLKKLLDVVNMSNVAALWDVHHPYRYFNETPELTYGNLCEYIRYLHVKDSVIDKNGTVHYKMMGKGDIPVEKVFSLVYNNNNVQYISLEWVKRWYSDLEAPGVVFMQFISYMNRLKRKYII